MQLSKEQLQAAIRLVRLDLLQSAVASDMSRKPCAPEVDSAPQAVAATTAESSVSDVQETGCSEQPTADAAVANKPVNPVRATSRPKPESLVDILAREAEESLKGLTSEMVNQSLRAHRRQRAKELKQAQKR